MSVLIKDMSLPESCLTCKLLLLSPCQCVLTGKSYNWGLGRRPRDCPLIELPPHGDLVDRNELLAEYDRQHEGEAGKARKIMEQAKTIIEAEGETE